MLLRSRQWKVGLRRFLKIGGLGCGGLVVLLVLVLLLAALVGPPDGSNTPVDEQGSKETDKKSASEEKSETGEPVPAVMMVSGEPGTPYRCSYSSFAFEEGERDPVRYESEDQGILGVVPVEYASQAIDARNRGLDFIHVTCRITNTGPSRPAQGSLRAQILVDGQVKAEEETRPDPPGKKSTESEQVQVRWAPRCPNWEVSWDCG